MTELIDGNIDIGVLLSAFSTFSEAIDAAKSPLERDGAIHRFEYTYELFWEVLRKILIRNGKICNSPRAVFREAAAEGIIADPKFWFEVIRKRNLTTQIYNEKVAETLFLAMPEIKKAMSSVIDPWRKEQ